MPPIAACRCRGPLFEGRPDRRWLLRSLGIAAVAASLPVSAHAAEGQYEAMLLSCIDPRIVSPVYKYMEGQGLSGRYSQFCIAGAAVAVVADKFKAWRPAFWDNTSTSYQLHRINRIIAIDHRDCGAAKIAYGAESVATPQAETATHKKALAEFREAVAKHHPQLAVVTGLMALDGSIEIFS
jgi:carbonic anhydrase